MKNIMFLSILACICIATAAVAAIEFVIANENQTTTIRIDTDYSDQEILYSGSIGVASEIHGDDASWLWLSITGVTYTGEDPFFNGDYDIFVEVQPFQRSQEGTFEGPVASNQSEIMMNGITPPPQDRTFPSIGRCNARSTIRSEGFKAKSSI
jgi:hypothetical protein